MKVLVDSQWVQILYSARHPNFCFRVPLAGLNVEIEVEKEHLYKNVKATCADSKMELKSYDEFGKCVGKGGGFEPLPCTPHCVPSPSRESLPRSLQSIA